MMWHLREGWGWWTVFGWIWMVVFWGLIIWAVFAIISRLTGGGGAPERPGPSARDILEQRYARGEITADQFEEMRARLERTTNDPVRGR
jgi:putative membrane protein